MHVELVQTVTQDQMRLDGALCLADGHRADVGEPLLSAESREFESSALDAVLMLHGVGGNFYSSSLLQTLTESLSGRGLSVLRVNTRGHDGLHTTRAATGVCYQGAAFEMVDECRWDVAAWLDWLVERGFRRIGICGHSLGAIKGLYSQAHEPHSAVQTVLALSPPRLSDFAFRNGPDSAKYLGTLQEAKEWVAQGEPKRLIRSRFPFPLYITAGGYVDKYGGERYNIQEFATQMRCPTLFVYGRKELDSGSVAFAGLDEAVRGWSEQIEVELDVCVLHEADHFYTGQAQLLADELTQWLSQRHLLPPSPS